PGIPRHRVGHRAKVDNLDILLEQGAASDPLAGNYTLVDWDEIVLAWEGEYDKFNVKMYDVNANLDNPSAEDKMIIQGSGVHETHHLDVATGDFNGDGRVDIITARDYDGMFGTIASADDDLNYDPWEAFYPGEHVYGDRHLRLATGDFDEDGQDEVVLAWEGFGVNLKIFDTYGGLYPWPMGKIQDETVGGDLDVATGDFDGDGGDEIVLVWTGEGGTNLWTKVYDVDRNGDLYAEARLQDEELHGGKHLAVSTGDFNGDAVDEIAVGWEGGSNKANLKIYQVTDNLGTLTAKGKNVEGEHGVHGDNHLSVATGDFNTDGTDEIVFAYEGQDDDIVVRVFASNSELDLDYQSEIVDERVGGDLSVAVGDMNRDVRAEIVLAWTGVGGTNLWTKVYQVATDLGSIEGKGRRQDEELHGGKHLAVAVGNFDGDSVRVERPHYSSNVVDAEQLIAVINEPPKHYDVIDGTRYNVNNNTDTYASYENEQRQSTEMSLTTTRDWGVSTGVEAEYGIVNASLTASYGEGFEKTTTSFREVAFGQLAWAASDDVIFRSETDYDVWEYPVYTDSTDAVRGHIVVIFPRKRNPSCSGNCEATTIARIDGKTRSSFHFPSHENHNLLSYSQEGPDDIGNLVKAAGRNYLGANPYQFWVEWSDVESDETKKSSQLDLSVGAEVEYWGIKASVEGTYGRGEVSTHKVSFQDTTAIHLYFDAIDRDYTYWVEPYVYWSSDDGHLVVDYAAGPHEEWWEITYDKPDPTFNLPWRYDDLDPAVEYKRLLSKEITFEPDSPMAGQTVTIQAKVRNYSLVGAHDVKVRFYRGDPDDGGVQIGSDQTISQLNPMDSATVSVQFDTAGYGGQSLEIYAVVDPEGEIEEMQEDYNKAYAILPVKVPGAPPLGPISLKISPEDIVFDPETPALGETVHISATVEAQGDTFTFVPVEFWDGDPRRGGQLIGGEVIPMIPAGETATASITWDTAGKYGAHDIWVHIDHHAGEEDISTDNWAYKTLDLPPFRLYLPLLRKSVQ
ncbi:MAG: CARDB domain-containing protein, partial [Anaerolineae bacterium]